jgi:F1F0 ATPase subunit 2
MNELLGFAGPLAAGLLLGAFFFGGLWWTIAKGLASPRPALWFFGSMLVRTGVLLTGFYLVGREDWRRWAVCLLGTVLARVIVRRVTRPPIDHHDTGRTEVRYAP